MNLVVRFIFFILLGSGAQALAAGPAKILDRDKAAIRQVIANQIKAVEREESRSVIGHSSPKLRHPLMKVGRKLQHSRSATPEGRGSRPEGQAAKGD
jgi:hypothetical protein